MISILKGILSYLWRDSSGHLHASIEKLKPWKTEHIFFITDNSINCAIATNNPYKAELLKQFIESEEFKNCSP